jgi:glycosyltransferase involved in cell wall biosynthesis
LARVLERRYEVEIVGPVFGRGIWEPLARESFAYRAVQVPKHLGGAPMLRQIAELADGDLLYANKLLAASYGVALWARLQRPRPLLVDIDDWDAGFVRAAYGSLPPAGKLRYLASSTLRPHLSHSLWNNLVSEACVSCADGYTVSNHFLQRRFGGELIWHGRDTDAFRPGRWDRDQLRREHGLDPNEQIAVFLGTMHPYKGVDDLVTALSQLQRSSTRLLLVGVGDDATSRQTLSRAHELLGGRVTSFGPQRFDRVPEFLALADVAVIPQRESVATVGQMPAKLFDAMALGVPVISTAVSDIPYALEGAGWVVAPNAPDQLATALEEALAGDGKAAGYAQRARQRCVEQFSWDAMERGLVGEVERQLQISRA